MTVKKTAYGPSQGLTYYISANNKKHTQYGKARKCESHIFRRFFVVLVIHIFLTMKIKISHEYIPAFISKE